MAQQQGMVNKLREASMRQGSSNTGFAGGLAPGLYGVGAAFAQKKQDAANEQYQKKKQENMDKIFKAWGIGPDGNSTPSPTVGAGPNANASFDPNGVSPIISGMQQQPQSAPPIAPYAAKKKDYYGITTPDEMDS
jgi:hypothetical protein